MIEMGIRRRSFFLGFLTGDFEADVFRLPLVLSMDRERARQKDQRQTSRSFLHGVDIYIYKHLYPLRVSRSTPR